MLDIGLNTVDPLASLPFGAITARSRKPALNGRLETVDLKVFCY